MKYQNLYAECEDMRRALASLRMRDFFLRVVTLGFFGLARQINEATSKIEKILDDLNALEAFEKLHNDHRLAEKNLPLSNVRKSEDSFTSLSLVNFSDYGADWDSVRGQVISRDGRICQEADGTCDGPLQVHHILPLSQGGTNDMNNLVTLCRYHHTQKHPHMQR